MLNAVLMPYVMEFNRKALTHKWDHIGQALGDEPLRWVLNIRRKLKIPNTLMEMGVPDDAVELASAATADPSAGTNPVPLDDASHRQLLEDALSGHLRANQIA